MERDRTSDVGGRVAGAGYNSGALETLEIAPPDRGRGVHPFDASGLVEIIDNPSATIFRATVAGKEQSGGCGD